MEIIKDVYKEQKLVELSKMLQSPRAHLHSSNFNIPAKWKVLSAENKQLFIDIIDHMEDYPKEFTVFFNWGKYPLENVAAVFSPTSFLYITIEKVKYSISPNQLYIPPKDVDIKISRSTKHKDDNGKILVFFHPDLRKGNYQKNLLRELYQIKDVFLLILDFLSAIDILTLMHSDSHLYRKLKDDQYWKRRWEKLSDSSHSPNEIRKILIQLSYDQLNPKNFLSREFEMKYFTSPRQQATSKKYFSLFLAAKYGLTKTIKEIPKKHVCFYDFETALILAGLNNQIAILLMILENNFDSISLQNTLRDHGFSSEVYRVIFTHLEKLEFSPREILNFYRCSVWTSIREVNFDSLSYLFSRVQISSDETRSLLLLDHIKNNRRELFVEDLVEYQAIYQHQALDYFLSMDGFQNVGIITFNELFLLATVAVNEYPHLYVAFSTLLYSSCRNRSKIISFCQERKLNKLLKYLEG